MVVGDCASPPREKAYSCEYSPADGKYEPAAATYSVLPSCVATLCMENVYVALEPPPYGNADDVDVSTAPRASTTANTLLTEL